MKKQVALRFEHVVISVIVTAVIASVISVFLVYTLVHAASPNTVTACVTSDGALDIPKNGACVRNETAITLSTGSSSCNSPRIYGGNFAVFLNLQNFFPNNDASNAFFTPSFFDGLNLSAYNFSNSFLSSSTFRSTNLTNVNFTGAKLQGVIFSNATLTGTNFTNSDLSIWNVPPGAGKGSITTDFTGATLSGVIWSNTICPDGTNSTADGGTCMGHF